jgi:nitrogen regulatory protein PII
MKAIVAYVQPFMLERVTNALRARKIHGVTVIRCEGFGRRIDAMTPHYEDPSVELLSLAY